MERIAAGGKLVDNSKNISYTVGSYLGKGAFAKCYELINDDHDIFAAKVISKHDVKTITNKDKIQREIQIHKDINHKNIVNFISYFQDENNIFIVLEYCSCQSLAELSKRRKTLLVPETRYFTKQIAEACEYLHDNLVIHRDLKLANVFLNSELVVKVGDFGLSAILDTDAEKKKTLCGTPNYLAPEVILKDGHSFEVDVWSLGVIIYTLIFGKPPFETSSINDTYKLITTVSYVIPEYLDLDVKEIILSIFKKDVNSRPTMKTLLEMSFFKGFTPTCLPISILSCSPRFNLSKNDMLQENRRADSPQLLEEYANLKLLQKQLMDMLTNINIISSISHPFLMRDSENPKLAPIFWVSKWVDATSDFGLFYMLNDNSTGSLLNDDSRLVLAPNEFNIQYTGTSNQEYFYTKEDLPEKLKKKMKVLNRAKDYMNQHLMTAGGDLIVSEQDSMIRLPYLRQFFLEPNAIVFMLSNDTLQVNFQQDHIKLVLCPFMGSVMIIDENSEIKTYKLSILHQNGITEDLLSKFHFVLSIIERTVL